MGGEIIGEKEMENGGSNAKYSERKRKRERIKEIALLRIKGFASEHSIFPKICFSGFPEISGIFSGTA